MANTDPKKVDIYLPPALYKAAKLQAMQAGQSVQDWFVCLVETAIQRAEPNPSISALDWGRIDSRIDQRTGMLERQIEHLAQQVQQLSDEQRSQLPLGDRSILPLNQAKARLSRG